MIHETWAYEEGSQRLTEELGFASQRAMYDQLEAAYEQAARDLGGISSFHVDMPFNMRWPLAFLICTAIPFMRQFPRGGICWQRFGMSSLRGRLWWAMHSFRKGCRRRNRSFCSAVP